MTVFAVILYTAVILVALMLIALVLVQQSKSGGLGGTFGGIGESLMGGQAGSHLTKLTVYLSVLFFVLVLVLAVAISRGWAIKSSESDVNKYLKKAEATQVVPVSEPVEAQLKAIAPKVEDAETKK